MVLSPRHRLISQLLALAAVCGFIGLLVLAAQHETAAPLLRILAFLWLIGTGAAKLVFDLTERAGQVEPSAGRDLPD